MASRPLMTCACARHRAMHAQERTRLCAAQAGGRQRLQAAQPQVRVVRGLLCVVPAFCAPVAAIRGLQPLFSSAVLQCRSPMPLSSAVLQCCSPVLLSSAVRLLLGLRNLLPPLASATCTPSVLCCPSPRPTWLQGQLADGSGPRSWFRSRRRTHGPSAAPIWAHARPRPWSQRVQAAVRVAHGAQRGRDGKDHAWSQGHHPRRK